MAHDNHAPGRSGRRPGLRSPSPLQQRVLRFVAEGQGHGVVEATAGSGKTTTLVQVAQLLPATRPACFLAFNRATAAELRARLPPHVEATTIHALGRRVLVGAFPGLGAALPSGQKYRDLALELLGSQRPHAHQPGELAEYLARLAGFVRLATAADRAPPDLAATALRHGLESTLTAGETPGLHQLVPPLLELGLQRLAHGNVDYTDMLYAPLMLRLPSPKFAFVCVDEAQDLSPLTLALVMQLVNAGARALFVGDPQQAIYAFAGADSRSIDRIRSTTSATVLPLSVSFRCPSRHVALARRYSPTMQAAPGAVAGSVRVISYGQLPRRTRPGDLIMCRVNAPLTGLQLRLAQVGTPSRVLGDDLAEPALALARHLFGQRLPHNAEQLVAAHAREEAERLERQLLTSPALAEVLRVSEDRHAALAILLRRLASGGTSGGARSLAQLEQVALRLLRGAALPPENDSRASPDSGAHTHGPSRDHVVLSTIHKAKGREAQRVFLLFPEELAPPTASLTGRTPQHEDPTYSPQGALADEPGVADADAEANVLFVALTRAKSELVLVERSEGALAERVRQARALLEGQRGGEQELARSWNQVLSLAQLMARPRRASMRWLSALDHANGGPGP